MIPLLGTGRGPVRLLVLGAHSDDIEIGCGATLARLREHCVDLSVDWVVFSGDDTRRAEAIASAEAMLDGIDHTVETLDFEETQFPWQGPALKAAMATVRDRCRPDLVLTHWAGDAHQDHRTIAELTLNAFRDHAILGYEIPKFDGDLGRPSVFVTLERSHVDAKLAHLDHHFTTQRTKPWFDSEVFSSILRMRGMECNAPGGYAEAFHPVKVRLL